MPEVALFSKPNGAPIASTHCPTCRLLELPRVTVGRLLAEILITATSETLSTPMTLAVYSRRSVSWTVTRLAPATTCALVRIRPSGWMMKPEPSPRTGCSGGAWKGKPRKNGANGLLGPKGLPSPSSVDFSITRMLTTAGPYFLTSVVKSGSITETPPRGCADGIQSRERCGAEHNAQYRCHQGIANCVPHCHCDLPRKFVWIQGRENRRGPLNDA